jgi:hypothetical protein
MAEATAMPSHPIFKLPRVPANRYVVLNWRSNDRPASDFEGLFITSGVENVGTEDEVYLLRRVEASRAPADFLKVRRRWQEGGGMTVFDLQVDPKYTPEKAAA